MSCVVCHPENPRGYGYRTRCALYNAAYRCSYAGCGVFRDRPGGCTDYLNVGALDCPQGYECDVANEDGYSMEGDPSRLIGSCAVNGVFAGYTFQRCCEVGFGGTFSYLGCPGPSCCGCDWCCNFIGEDSCEATRSYPWETLPRPQATLCVGAVCAGGVSSPVCRGGEFPIGKRPAAHEPPERGGTAHVGRHELHSAGLTRAIDRAPGVEECRTHYGHIGRGGSSGSAPATKHSGWLCGQYNRRVSSTKRANSCYLSKRPDGRHSFNCAYRVPCPEKPAVCL
jgi:hypothetical protein